MHVVIPKISIREKKGQKRKIERLSSELEGKERRRREKSNGDELFVFRPIVLEREKS